MNRKSFTIAIIVFGLMVSNCVSANESKLTEELLRQVIVAHYYAIGENRLDQAMRQYHSQSPELVQTRARVELGLSQFLLRTTTLRFCYNGQEGDIAVATARHRYLMISGIKFIEDFDEVVYRLREEQGSWKIWTRRENSNGEINSWRCRQSD